MPLKKGFPIIFIFLILSALLAFSQTAEDADKLFDEGQKLFKQYRFEKAIEKFLAAAELDKKIGKERQGYLLDDYLYIGVCYYYLGQYGEAIDYYERALAIAEELGNKDYIAEILNNTGAVYYAWGQYDKALEYFKQALAIDEELELQEEIAIDLNNIGNVYYSWEQYDKALEYFKQALAIAEELGLKEETAIRLNNIGTVYHSWGQYDKALEYYNQALAIDEELGLKDQIAIDLSNIGAVYNSWGQHDKALEYYKKALAIDEELGRRHLVAIRLNNIGTVYFYQNKYKLAAEYFNNSINIKEELRLTAIGTLRMDYLASQISTYQCLIYTYILDNKPEMAFDTIELSSAKYLAEQMGERIGQKELSFKGISSYQKNIDNKSVIINFANIDWDYSAIVVVSKDTIYATVVNKHSFIESINTQYELAITKTVEDLRGLEVVAKQDELEQKQKTSKKEFDNIINYYRYLLSKQILNTEEIGALEQIARELYNLLIAPIEKQLEGKTELIIIPDGILCFLPFETLIMPDGRYLIEKYHIKYTQSLTVSELIEKRNYSNNRKSLLAFGGAVYDEVSYEFDMLESEQYLAYLRGRTLAAIDKGGSTRSAYNELGLGEWGNLPGTLAEVIAIGRIIPDSVIYKGADVNEYKVKQLSKSGLLDDYKVLHFATHGLVVSEIPELSALVLSLFKNEQNNQDGYLTMKEIAMLDIKADFVNLSACQTGLGKIYGGEGVVGLTQSFLIAGANGLSVSLWKVADESTMQFMIGMYTLVQEQGYTYDRAITAMKRRFINRTNQSGTYYSRAFYWAPFVYYGE